MENKGICHKGSILIITMMFMIVLSILVISFIESVRFNVRVNSKQYDEVQALYLAEAGINKAIYYLRNTAPNNNTTGTWYTNVFPGGTPNTSAAACSSTTPCKEPLYTESGTYTYGVYPNGSSYPVVGTYTMWVQQDQSPGVTAQPLYCGYGNCIQITAQGTVNNTSRYVQDFVTQDTTYRGLYATPIFDQWEECNGTSCSNIADGLVGWWTMDDVSGTTVVDSSGYGYNGTNSATNVPVLGVVNGAPGSGAASSASGALSLNGTSQYATVASSGNLNFAGPITLSAWVYPKISNAYQCIIDRAASGASRQYAVFLSTNGTGQVFVAMNGSSFNTNIAVSPGWTVNAWNHIVVTADGTTIKVYINSVLAGSVANVNDSATATATTYIGYDYTNTNYYFNGYIDDVRVYNRALSADEVNMLYNFR